MPELRPPGVHLVVVPLSEKPYLLRNWASGVGAFTAVDLDCSLLPLFAEDERKRLHLLLEGGDVVSAVMDVYSLPKCSEPLVVNSLGTLQAEARAFGGERDWSRRFFKHVVYLATACAARADCTLMLVNFIGDRGAKGVMGAGWVKICSLAFDGAWVLSEDGLSRLA